MMNGVGDAIVLLKIGKEKGKCKKKPAELEEGKNMQEELGDGKSWKGKVVLGFAALAVRKLDLQLYGLHLHPVVETCLEVQTHVSQVVIISSGQ